MALTPIGDSSLPINQQELQSHAKKHKLTFVTDFLENLNSTSEDQIRKPSSSFWRRALSIPSKEQSLKGQLLAIAQTGAANITIPGLKKSASSAEKTEALKRHSFKLLEDLNESLGGKLGKLQANVARAQRKVDLISSNTDWDIIDKKLNPAKTELNKAKKALSDYQRNSIKSVELLDKKKGDASPELQRESFEGKTFDFTLLDREIESIDLKINTLTERLKSSPSEQKNGIQKQLEEELANKIVKLATAFEISSSPQKEERQTMLEKTIDELDKLNPKKANRKRFLYNLEPKRYPLPKTTGKSSQIQQARYPNQSQTPAKPFSTTTPPPFSSSKTTPLDIELTKRKTHSPETTGESDDEN